MSMQALFALVLIGLGGQSLPRPAVAPPRDALSVAAAITGRSRNLVVCDTVQSVAQRDDSRLPAQLDLGGADTPQRLAVIVQPKDIEKFNGGFGPLLLNRMFCVEGRVQPSGAGAQLELKDPKQVKFVGQPSRQSQFASLAPTPGGSISPPAAVRQLNARYTSNALKAKITGDVEVEMLVGADGTVKRVRLQTSLDPLYGLDESAVSAARQWTFTPAHRDGQPVDCVVTMVLSFRVH